MVLLWAGMVIGLCVMGILVLISVTLLLTLPFFALIIIMLMRMGVLQRVPGLRLVFMRFVQRSFIKRVLSNVGKK